MPKEKPFPVKKLDHSHLKWNWQKPRCVHRRAEGSYTTKYSRYDLARCKMIALYDVDGELLCERHAGRRLVDYYVEK